MGEGARSAAEDLPVLCEDRGFSLPHALEERLRAPFEASELERGFARAALTAATPAAPGRSPIAVWLVGPAAAGKSTVGGHFALELGVPARTDALGFEPDAVQVDGELLRLEHSGYQAVVQDGFARGCVWREAYPAIREQLRSGKDNLLQQAVRRRQHVVIPHTCQRLERDCLGMLRALKRAGYVNHVVTVEGDRAEIQQRGEQRAQALGKRYAPEEYEQSLRSFEPMIREANGQVIRVWNTGADAPRIIARSVGGAASGAVGARPPCCGITRQAEAGSALATTATGGG